jgi:hypothetical protein
MLSPSEHRSSVQRLCEVKQCDEKLNNESHNVRCNLMNMKRLCSGVKWRSG